MADDKHYVGGEWYRICDRTGFKMRAPVTRKEWTNRIVRTQSWEPRQPQDFVRGVKDDQSVSDPRPRQLNQFQGPLGTTLTAQANAGTNILQIGSSVRMFVGDKVTIMLSTNENFYTTLTDVPSLTTVQIANGLPQTALNGAVFIDVSAESDPTLYQNPYGNAL